VSEPETAYLKFMNCWWQVIIICAGK
jgi:hypothetical protein